MCLIHLCFNNTMLEARHDVLLYLTRLNHLVSLSLRLAILHIERKKSLSLQITPYISFYSALTIYVIHG